MVERLVHLLGIRAAARLRQLPSEPPASERRDAAQPSMQAAHADMAEESSRLAAQRALCRCGDHPLEMATLNHLQLRVVRRLQLLSANLAIVLCVIG